MHAKTIFALIAAATVYAADESVAVAGNTKTAVESAPVAPAMSSSTVVAPESATTEAAGHATKVLHGHSSSAETSSTAVRSSTSASSSAATTTGGGKHHSSSSSSSSAASSSSSAFKGPHFKVHTTVVPALTTYCPSAGSYSWGPNAVTSVEKPQWVTFSEGPQGPYTVETSVEAPHAPTTTQAIIPIITSGANRQGVAGLALAGLAAVAAL